MKLKLGRGIELPPQAITETFGILAARGAGKTNTGVVMAEEMYAVELPFVVVDPVGSWWGMRSSKSGAGPGLDIPLFGGRRGDVPLERTGGNLIADLVVDEQLSCILDLTEFDSEGAKRQFLLDFARRLYRRNELPLHLFLEEADDYIPQNVPRADRGESAAIPAMLLRAWENIVRRGRTRGLGMTLITQRSASINKNVLTQVQTLIAMRTTGPHDRKAIEDWVKYNHESSDILKTLPELENGEAWIWSPQFLGMTKRAKFRRRRTFDSGSTPKVKAKKRVAKLADVNVDRLREQMADTIERAERDDPKVLRQRIEELKAELAKLGKTGKQAAVAPAVDADWLLKNIKLRNDELNKRAEKHRKFFETLDRLHKDFASTLDQMELIDYPEAVMPSMKPGGEEPTAVPKTLVSTTLADVTNDSLTTAEGRVLRAFYWLRSEEANVDKVSFYSGYRKTGHLTNTLASLRSKGLLAGWQITSSGEQLIGAVADEKPTGPELREWLRPKLDKACNALLDVLMEERGNRVSDDELCSRAGYRRTGHYTNSIGRLRSIGAAVGCKRDGGIRIAEVFLTE